MDLLIIATRHVTRKPRYVGLHAKFDSSKIDRLTRGYCGNYRTRERTKHATEKISRKIAKKI